MKCIMSENDFIQLVTATESFRLKEGPQLQKILLQRYISLHCCDIHYSEAESGACWPCNGVKDSECIGP